MKYSVGDIVVILKDLSCGITYGSYGAAQDMLRFRGREVRIADIYVSPSGRGSFYRIAEDNGAWKWTDKMISGYAVINDESIDLFDFDVTEMLGVI